MTLGHQVLQREWKERIVPKGDLFGGLVLNMHIIAQFYVPFIPTGLWILFTVYLAKIL